MTRWPKLPPGLKVAGSAPVPKVKGARGLMNKTEAAYAQVLKLSQAAGEVRWWAYEPIKFRLAKRTHLTPDFMVWGSDGAIEVIEVKGGFVRDDAACKFKIGRELYPMFQWRMVQFKNGRWKEILC